MVNITNRMSRLREVLKLKVGRGAAILPPEVTKIHMDFVRTYDEGHKGPRGFWRSDLRRLKYHNPAVPMTVSRTLNPDDPALLTVHFAPSSTSTSTDSPPKERTEVFNIKNRKPFEILDQLLELTKATRIEATEDQLAEFREFAEKRTQSMKDAALMQKVNDRKKQEARRMAIARGEVKAES